MDGWVESKEEWKEGERGQREEERRRKKKD